MSLVEHFTDVSLEALQKDKSRTNGKPSKLETLGIVTIISFLLSIFFLSNNIVIYWHNY